MLKQNLENLYRSLVQKYGSEPEAQGRVFFWMRKLYDLFSADVMIGFFFAGKDLDHIARKQTEFILRAMGATPSYFGHSPGTAHLSLPPILAGHFDRRLMILRDYLLTQGLTADQVEAWAEFEKTFREAVTRK